MEVGKHCSRMQSYTCGMKFVLYTNYLYKGAVIGRMYIMTPNTKPNCFNNRKVLLSYIPSDPETR